ncbi:hypothetical protein BDN70DRAFT_899591 [Pholiota conissans]|uniref:Uncharacterized protein n=1 Tax=Pholiota conissans TaxID=109636 RepID=A0A9P5YRA9_9AGAR|nr:hypothetical protein BDN70DRAFT_899591 [Pholiota conissans]
MVSNNTQGVVKWKWVPPIVPTTNDLPQNSAQVASRIHPYHPDKLPPFSERPQSTTTFTFIPVAYEKDIDPYNCVVFGPDYKTRHASITTSAYVTTIVLFLIVDGEERLTSRYLELSSDRVYRDMVIGDEVFFVGELFLLLSAPDLRSRRLTKGYL